MTARTRAAVAPAGDPARIATRADFASELNLVREWAGLTIRELAGAVGLPASTVGGYFGGAHLPAPRPPRLLARILEACGVTDPATIAHWEQALRRVRRRTGPGGNAPVPTESPSADQPEAPPAQPPFAEPVRTAAVRTALVSTRPPVDRLAREPTLRGRDELMDLLDAELGESERDRGRPVYVLHGLGGSGKSTVALALAQRALARGIPTWWIFASAAEAVWAGMHALAAELGATPDQLRIGSTPDLVWRLLAAFPRPWLLIVDNADDPPGTLALPDSDVTDGTGWLRPVEGRYGMTVLTTRDGGGATWGEPPAPWVRLIPVGRLGATDGGLVLRGLAGPEAGSGADAEALAERLGGLPLALSLTGRYLGEAGAIPPAIAGPQAVHTFADFAAALGQGRHDELFTPPAGSGLTDRRARDLIGRAWEPSLDLLAERGMAHARPLLRLLSCFEPAPIPHGLLLMPEVLARSPLFPGITRHDVWAALRALTGLGLVDLVRTDSPDVALGSALTLHSLVRETSRRHPEVRTGAGAYLDLVTELLDRGSAALDPTDPSTWDRWQAFAEHCQSPVHLIGEYEVRPSTAPAEILRPAIRSTRFLRATGQLHRAEATCGRMLRVGSRAIGSDHPDVLTVEHDLARVLYDLGCLDAAARALRAVLEARLRVLGPAHPDTLTTQHYLARVLRDRGEYGPAERLLRQTLDARRKVLGEIHPDTLTTRSVAADVLRARGRLDSAETEMVAVLDAQIRVVGAEHPATLVTRYHLARLRHDRGELTEAADQLTALLDTDWRILGTEHPRTLTTLQALVDVRHDLGRLDEAEAGARGLLDARERTLGAEHPATLATRHRLGLILTAKGDFAAADAELAATLAVRRRVLAPRHPDTTANRADLDALRRRS